MIPLAVVERAATDPLFLQHILSSKNEAFLLDLLFAEASKVSQSASVDLSSMELAARAAQAALEWVKSGARLVSEEVLEGRTAACEAREHRIQPPSSTLYRLMRTKSVCGLCGCDTDKKVRSATEACPAVPSRW